MNSDTKFELASGLFVVVMLIAGFFMGGDQFFARYLGGTQTIELEEGVRLQTITWRKGDMWLLTYKDPNKPPQTYSFQEDSMLNVLEGTVTIVEK